MSIGMFSLSRMCRGKKREEASNDSGKEGGLGVERESLLKKKTQMQLEVWMKKK